MRLNYYTCVISGFCCEVDENCALLGGNFLPTFWDNLLVPTSGFKNPKESFLPQYGFYIGKTVSREKLPPSHFVHVSVLFLTVTPVSIPSIMEHFSPSCTNHHTLLQPNPFFFFLLSVGLPVANAPHVLQPCSSLYYP